MKIYFSAEGIDTCRMRCRMKSEHQDYYAYQYEKVRVEGEEYQLGYSEEEAYTEEVPKSFRWVTSGGNILEVIYTSGQPTLLRYTGARAAYLELERFIAEGFPAWEERVIYLTSRIDVPPHKTAGLKFLSDTGECHVQISRDPKLMELDVYDIDYVEGSLSKLGDDTVAVCFPMTTAIHKEIEEVYRFLGVEIETELVTAYYAGKDDVQLIRIFEVEEYKARKGD